MDGASFQGIAYWSGLRTICYARTEFVKMEWEASMGRVWLIKNGRFKPFFKNQRADKWEDRYFRGPLQGSLGSVDILRSQVNSFDPGRRDKMVP